MGPIRVKTARVRAASCLIAVLDATGGAYPIR